MLQNYFVFVILLLLVCPVVPKRSSVGGGGFSRGNSAARGGVASGGFNAGGRPSSGFSNQGGFNQGGFHPNNQGGFHGNPSGGFHSPPGQGFRNGNGLGSSQSSGTFKKALIGGALGAAGGILAYEAGKAIIQSATTPFNYGGRNYYWDNNYQGRNGEIQCSMPLSQLQQLSTVPPTTTTTTTTATSEPGNAGETTAIPSTTPNPDHLLNTLQFSDGSRPKHITWGCRSGTEICCGTDCCPAPQMNSQGGSSGVGMAGLIIGVLFFLFVIGCCCCFLVYKFCRSALDCVIPSSNKYQEGYQGDIPPQHQYPMQSYPQSDQGHAQEHSFPPNAYSQSHGYAPNTYPQSHGYPNAYPSHPTY